MSEIMATVEDLIVEAVVGGKALLPHINKAEWALLATSALFAVTGVFFLALSLNRYFENIYAPDKAALVSAVVVFTGALLAMMLRALLRLRKESNIESSRKEIRDNIHVLIRDVCTELEDPVRENPKTAVAVAALAGFLAVNNHRG